MWFRLSGKREIDTFLTQRGSLAIFKGKGQAPVILVVEIEICYF